MEGMMRQMVMAGPRKSKIIEVPIPQYNDDEMLVKVTLTGMCHSEWYPWATAREGDILGHEAIGVVAEVGKNVEGFKVGDRVTGLGGGAYREYIVVSPKKTAHVPDCLKDEDAISEPLACLLSAAMKLPVETLGDTVAVVGCGYMGLGTIALFKAMGYGDIIAIDKRPETLENAKKFGATETYLPEEIPEMYRSNFETIGKADLTRSGDNANVFAPGVPTVMEFTGTEDGLQLAGVCDNNEASAQEKSRLFNVPILTMEEIKADPEIRLVVNLTGPAAHYPVIKELLEAGKNVFTEKMLCVDFEQGKELAALAKEKGLYLGVAPDTFLGAGLQTARLLIDRGMIGQVTSARAAINRSQALNSELLRFIRNPGGGFAYDLGVYYVTALLALLGPVKKVTGFVSEAREHEARILRAGDFGKVWKTADSNLYAGSLLFEGGAVATLHLDGESIDEEQPSLVIYGTEGILKLGDPNRFDGSVRLIRNNAPETVMPFTHGFTGAPLYGPETPADYGQHRGAGAAEMAWAMIGHRPHRASAEMGLHAMEILHGLDISSAEERVYRMTTTFKLPAPIPPATPIRSWAACGAMQKALW